MLVINSMVATFIMIEAHSYNIYNNNPKVAQHGVDFNMGSHNDIHRGKNII